MTDRANTEGQMKKVIDRLRQDFSALRTGRANVALLDTLKVEYYGSMMPIQQIANVSAVDGRTLEIKPWDKEGLQSAEQAIIKSDLGLNPVNDGKIIRLSLPAPTEERRKDLIRVVRKLAEEFRVTIRNLRRDAVESFKSQEKEKKISEDDLRRSEQDIQKLTDQYIKTIDSLLTTKEKEILEV